MVNIHLCYDKNDCMPSCVAEQPQAGQLVVGVRISNLGTPGRNAHNTKGSRGFTNIDRFDL